MLGSIDTCQNKVYAHQHHVTIPRVQVKISSRSHVSFLVDSWPSAGFRLDPGPLSG